MEMIKKINVPMALLCLMSLRLLIADSAYAVALGLLGLTGLYAYSLYLKSKQVKTLDKQVQEELESMKAQISNLTVKNNLNKPSINPNQRFF